MTGRTPIRDLGRRAPEHGRIRTGKKSEKGYPTKLDTFRFTSSDEDALRRIADRYGGEVYEWKGAPGQGRQFEVVTNADRIAIAIEEGCLGDGPVYELWAGGYCTRRCDGEVCEQPETGPDGPEMVPGPCVCATEKGPAKCKGKLRLNVVLTDVPFGGTWRLETSSEHALRELPGMVDMILAMKAGGLLTTATLVLDQRSTVKFVDGKAQTRNYAVPMLAIPHSLEDLQSGAAQLGTYGTPVALESGVTPARSPDSRDGVSEPDSDPAPGSGSDDDDVAEAEVLDPISNEQFKALTMAAADVAGVWTAENPEDPITGMQLLQAAAGMLAGNPNQRVAEIDVEHGARLGRLLEGILSGDIEFRGIRDGRVKTKGKVRDG